MEIKRYSKTITRALIPMPAFILIGIRKMSKEMVFPDKWLGRSDSVKKKVLLMFDVYECANSENADFVVQ